MMRVVQEFPGVNFTSLRSTSSGVLPGARPVRLATRKTWVSTAIVGWPKATLSTTFAVLRPTPGSLTSAAWSAGTTPPCASSSCRHSVDDVPWPWCDRGRWFEYRGSGPPRQARAAPAACSRPERAWPWPDSRCGRWPGPRARPQSAVRTASRYSSSLRGCGFCARRRRKISRRLAGFIRARPGAASASVAPAR